MQLRLTPDGCELALFYPSPTAAEVHEIRGGLPQWAWVELDGIAVLAFRFGTLQRADTPYQVTRDETARDQSGPIDPEGKHLIVSVVLVDAHTGIIKGLRALTWPPEFATAVRDTVQRQLDSPITDAQAGIALQALYDLYPDTASLVRERADVRA
ncbi:hypothetical protein FHR32_000857 [Streptosporangium album]|uniref:Uncharacterized protein n=1 Tax=Streptosporangium album TaxID=47479 RepID=A0A7W7W6S0_9ACTN|nr:hypothetical protein [Streptosporangium album]MBB4936552.1 hypothetical protein [Streptosporangium album]